MFTFALSMAALYYSTQYRRSYTYHSKIRRKQINARFRHRTSREPYRMLMRGNKGFFSFVFDSAYAKYSVHRYPDIRTFSFRIRLPSTRIRRIRQRIRIFLRPLTRVEKNTSATNPITCGRVNPDIFESDDVAK